MLALIGPGDIQQRRYLLLCGILPLPSMVAFGCAYWFGLAGPIGSLLGMLVFGGLPSYLIGMELVRRGRLHLAAFILISYAIVELGFVSLYQGGVASPSLHWIAALPAAAALISRAAAAVSWSGCLLVFAGFLMIDLLHWPTPAGVSQSFVERMTLPTVAGGGLFAVTFFALYEHLQQRTLATLRATNRALIAARRESELANSSKSRFLSRMSHELRTPFTAILGFSDLMQEDSRVGASEIGQALCGLKRNAEHLLQVVSDLIRISETEDENVPILERPYAPAQLIADVGDLLRSRAELKGIELETLCSLEVPEALVSDAGRLRQILINLVGNSIKFTQQGKISLTCETDFDANELVITVADTGIGISEQQQARLFSPFVQADRSTSRIYGGTGLGLSISQNLAHALGGSIDVHSIAGQGTTTRVRLPIKLPDPAHTQSADPSPVGIRGTDLRGLRVLVVDDTRDNRVLLCTLLRRAGARVEVAEGGAEAITALESALGANAAPDLILMDLQMPEIDGHSAMERIREQGFGGRIVALTADALPETRARCLREGFDDFATKPIRREELIALAAGRGRLAHSEIPRSAESASRSASGSHEAGAGTTPANPAPKAWGPRGLWQRIVACFVPPCLEHDPSSLRQARMVIESTLVPVALTPIALLVVAHSFEPAVRFPLMALMSLTPPLCVAFLLALRCTGSIRFSGYGLLVYGASIISSIAAFSGGIGSFAASWLTLVPVLALAWFGMRPAAGFTVVVLALWTGITLLGSSDARSAEFSAGITHAVSLVCCTTFLTALGVIYHRTTVEATNALARSNQELSRARDTAAVAAESKGRFLATISHEMRTPVGAILGFSDMIREELDSPKHASLALRTSHLEGVERNGRRLLERLDDLLDLAKIEAGKLELEPMACDPRELLREVVEQSRSLADANGVELQLESEAALPDHVSADASRLKLMLKHLVANAIHASSKGKVRLHARCDLQSETWSVRVTDQGAGLPLCEQRRLTEGRIAQSEGGLGLALCSGLGKLMQAEFQVFHTEELGTTIEVRLPIGLSELEIALLGADAATAEKSIESVAELRRGCSVLLVEDSTDNQRLIRRMLERAGASVEIASDGVQALEAVARTDDLAHSFDAILMDMQLPVLDGHATTRQLRDRGCSIPIVALTADSSTEARRDCLASGCTSFASKPIDRKRLISTLSLAIRTHHAKFLENI